MSDYKKNLILGPIFISLNAISIACTAGSVKYLSEAGYWPPRIGFLLLIIYLLVALLVLSLRGVIKAAQGNNYKNGTFWLCVLILTYPFLFYCVQGLL